MFDQSTIAGHLISRGGGKKGEDCIVVKISRGNSGSRKPLF